MALYKNISNKELPTLLRAVYEECGKNIEDSAEVLDELDTMLGVLKAKSLINSRERSARTRWTRGRNLRAILEQIILVRLNTSINP